MVNTVRSVSAEEQKRFARSSFSWPQSFTFARDQLRRIAAKIPGSRDGANDALNRLHLHRKLLSTAEAKRQPLVDEQFAINVRLSELRAYVGNTKDPIELADAQEMIRDAEEALALIGENLNTVSHEVRILSKRVEACEAVFSESRARNATLLFAKRLPPIAPHPKDILDKLAKCQANLTNLAQEKRNVEAAILPAAFAKKRVLEALDRRAAPPFVGRIVDGTEADVYFSRPLRIDGVGNVDDGVGLLCWLFRDQIADRLATFVDEQYDGRLALSPDERKGKLVQIAVDQLALEREEEALIWAGLQLRMQIGTNEGYLPVRADASPQAILGLADGDYFGPPGSAPPHADAFKPEPPVFRTPESGGAKMGALQSSWNSGSSLAKT